MVSTIRRAALHLGQPLRDEAGLWLHSGHALRVTGAQGLSRAGLSTYAIQLIGRWGSDAVLGYIRMAPLYASHRFAAAALAGWGANGSLPSNLPDDRLNQWTTPPAPIVCRRPAVDPKMASYKQLEQRLCVLEDRATSVPAAAAGDIAAINHRIISAESMISRA